MTDRPHLAALGGGSGDNGRKEGGTRGGEGQSDVQWFVFSGELSAAASGADVLTESLRDTTSPFLETKKETAKSRDFPPVGPRQGKLLLSLIRLGYKQIYSVFTLQEACCVFLSH